MTLLRAFLVSLRVDQWLKNAFVLAPLIFARHLFDTAFVTRVVMYAGLFCLVSSAVYLFNDFIDREKDLLHPEKKNRPIASGLLPQSVAVFSAAILAALGIGCAFVLSDNAGMILTLYAANNLLYSLALKRVAILDVMLIAAGFVLRVIGGAYVIDVEASVWLILCTFLISLFLGFVS